ncbi:MAG: phosphate/phosphite/phosphonate ABC transporter substrate-binding protein [Actinomycetota bacterium]|nr:phosphate/phosphite/phosphonate ABC transporter substrate-binding protein [Actinomycetota bacterium]MDA2999765.1 phosphate/phosphite/phosphonate ABC transporter substrate-binding protein [Actinomycetota bacterium]
MRGVKRSWLAISIVAALTLSACGSDSSNEEGSDTGDVSSGIDKTDWPEKLVVGAVPSEESSSLEQSYAPLVEALAEQLGIEVEFFQATDYAGIIEAQVAGRVDLAQYGPFSYVLAKTRGAQIDVTGVMTESPDIEPGYQSYGIAKADNDEINDIADFAGKKVCFVDPGSTSGYLYPIQGLIVNNIDPETGVTPVFAGGHDSSVLSVKNGDCEAGFAFDAMVDSNLIESGQIAEGEIKTVWKSEMIAGSPIAHRTTLPATLIAEIQRIVLEDVNTDKLIADGKCTSVEDCGLTDENVWGWVTKDDSFFDGVRAVCEATKSTKCE